MGIDVVSGARAECGENKKNKNKKRRKCEDPNPDPSIVRAEVFFLAKDKLTGSNCV